MCAGTTLLVGWLLVLPLAGEPDGNGKKFGIDPDLKNYPQATPQEALASVLKAIDNKRIDYLLAQLADQEYVARRVAYNGGKFDAFVKDTTDKLSQPQGPVKQLRQFQKEGVWKVEEKTATLRHKEIDDRAVFMKKVGSRWFLENDARLRSATPRR
jgi:hypothetical protein